ncbi:MAG: hypothetical protein HYW48_00625 [Deltaproteobacteria bacterium]|nr:hypothetical protein [Deltaproteobacteria bacterium]
MEEPAAQFPPNHLLATSGLRHGFLEEAAAQGLRTTSLPQGAIVLRAVLVFLFFIGFWRAWGQEEISFDFPDPVELETLVKQVSSWTDKNVILGPAVKGKVQFIAPRKLTKVEAYQAFLSALDLLGFSVLETGQVIKVLAKREVLQNIPDVKRALPFSDKVVTQVFPLKYASADQMRIVISNLVSAVSINPYAPSNVLIVTDTGYNLWKVVDILSLLDQKGSGFKVDFVRIVNFSASEMETFIKEAFKGDKILTNLRLLTEGQRNEVILAGKQEETRRIKEFIVATDKPSQIKKVARRGIFVRPLAFSDAKKMSSVLNALSPSTQRGDKQGSADLKITADESTNSLLISGTDHAYRRMNGIIRRLDIQRKQVFFKIDVVDVAEGHNLDFLPSLLAGVGEGQGAKTILGFESQKMAPVVLAGAEGATSQQKLSSLSSFKDDLSVGVFANKQVTFPGVGAFSPGAILNLVKADTSATVISTPTLLTAENEEASFSVGRQFIYNRFDADEAGLINKTVEKEKVELAVTLTPKVNAAGSDVRLDISIDANTVTNVTAEGIPLVGKRKARQIVHLKNGQTILISGIQNTSRLENMKKAPLLGDIPLLGLLFTRRSTELTTTHTMIFATPYVVVGSEDLKEIFRSKLESGVIPEETQVKMGLQ